MWRQHSSALSRRIPIASAQSQRLSSSDAPSRLTRYADGSWRIDRRTGADQTRTRSPSSLGLLSLVSLHAIAGSSTYPQATAAQRSDSEAYSGTAEMIRTPRL